MEIINAHAHIYPKKIAKKATDAIGDFYDIKMQVEEGSPELLLEKELKYGVKYFIVHSCATKKEQVRSINEFILSEIQKHKEFLGFMTLHPSMGYGEIVNEINFCMNNGFKGIKLHPDFQRFNIDDESAENIYKAVLETKCNFPILLHIGDNRYTYSKPFRLVNMAKKYPNVIFIGAHFGGYRCWDDAELYKGIKNVYFDTSSSLSFISSERAEALIRMLGVEKFFFGDDFPMWNIKEELDRFLKINLTEEERQMILSSNIKKLLNI